MRSRPNWNTLCFGHFAYRNNILIVHPTKLSYKRPRAAFGKHLEVGKNISKRELSLFYKTDPFAPLPLSLDMWWGRPGGVYGGGQNISSLSHYWGCTGKLFWWCTNAVDLKGIENVALCSSQDTALRSVYIICWVSGEFSKITEWLKDKIFLPDTGCL